MLLTHKEFENRHEFAGYSIEAKQNDREKIIADVSEWIKKGGKVKRIGSDNQTFTIQKAKSILRKHPRAKASSEQVSILLNLNLNQLREDKEIRDCFIKDSYWLEGIVRIYNSRKSNRK